MTAQTGFFILLTIVNLLGMFIFYRILKTRFSSKKILDNLRSEVDKLIADLGREADRDVGILEDRVKNLRALIDEADRRILMADREGAKRQESQRLMTQAQQKVEPKAEPTVEPVQAHDRVEIRREEPMRRPVTVYSRTPVVTKSEKPIQPLIPLHEQVLELARKGISSEMIAHTLSVPLGEVELILDMNHSSL